MRNIVRKKLLIVAALLFAALLISVVYSHCQIPCGIYDDAARFDMMAEHIATIEKSMQEILHLSKQQKPAMNQIVRWVNNKDFHADELSEIATYYFMAQRVKPVERGEGVEYEDYIRKISLLHEIVFYSMKAKQTTELSHVEKLRQLLSVFRNEYYKKRQ